MGASGFGDKVYEWLDVHEVIFEALRALLSGAEVDVGPAVWAARLRDDVERPVE